MNLPPNAEYRREDRGYATPCWMWLGSTWAGGYGQLRVGGTPVYAHRYYYSRFAGPIPAGYHVHHECKVTLCVNPDHLKALPGSAHMSLHSRSRVGDLSATAKLTDTQVREIRMRYASGEATQVQLAELYGVRDPQISRIIRGRRRASNADEFAPVVERAFTSRYRGVSRAPRGRWQAHICSRGEKRSLGLFDTEREAALAYDQAATVMHGSRARPNFGESA